MEKVRQPVLIAATPGSAIHPQSPRFIPRRCMLPLLMISWLVATAGGIGALWSYASVPGREALAMVDWPISVSFSRSSISPTLVMVLHPHCACSRASVRQLRQLMQQCGDHATVYAVIVRPEGCEPGWEQSDLRAMAADIPGVHLITDIGGKDAHRFGAFTSGQVFLYSSEGKLQFSGGITAARGHEDRTDPGAVAVETILKSDPVCPLKATTSTPVFGCSIWSPEDLPNSGEHECHK